MHIEQIHFDEVFDVQAGRGDFGFRSRGRAHYGVNLQNRVIPRPGSTFAVAFEKPGDWLSVIGSRDLASKEVVLARPTWLAFLLHAGDFFLFGLPFIVATLVLGGSWPGLVLAALLALAIAYVVVRGVRVNRAARQALLGIGQNDIHRDNGSSAPASSVQ